MAYFIFKISPGKQLKLLGEMESYREARDKARELRAGLEEGDQSTIKINFADDQMTAETQLTTEREAPIVMEHEK